MIGTNESYGFDMSYLDPQPYGVNHEYIKPVYNSQYYKKKICSLVYLDNLPFWKGPGAVTRQMVNLVDAVVFTEGDDFYFIDTRTNEIVWEKDFNGV